MLLVAAAAAAAAEDEEEEAYTWALAMKTAKEVVWVYYYILIKKREKGAGEKENCQTDNIAEACYSISQLPPACRWKIKRIKKSRDRRLTSS